MQLSTEQAAIVLLRKHFDNLLVAEAQRLGADFRAGVEGERAHPRRRPGGRACATATKRFRADYVLCADGAHSIFSWDERPKRTISTLMGWWEDLALQPGTMEMIFDKHLSPLYGWMFPEARRTG